MDKKERRMGEDPLILFCVGGTMPMLYLEFDLHQRREREREREKETKFMPRLNKCLYPPSILI